MKLGQLIIRKIFKIIATRTRCHILRLKCTKFDSGWGSAPDPAGRAYIAGPPTFPCLPPPMHIWVYFAHEMQNNEKKRKKQVPRLPSPMQH